MLQRWKPKFFKYDATVNANTYFLRFSKNWNMGIRVMTYLPRTNNFVDVGNIAGVSQDLWLLERVGELPSSNTGPSGNPGSSGKTGTSGNPGTTSTSTPSATNAPNNMKGYRGQNGTVFTFTVTGKKDGGLWGGNGNIYTDDSDIAKAAVHAGLVKEGQTAIIKVKVMPGQSSYTGSTRNGVTSSNWGKYDGSYYISK